MEYYFMSKKELNQAEVLGMLKRGVITQEKAAELCELSTRQIRRKLKRFLALGSGGIAHQSRGKASNRALGPSIVDRIIMLFKETYRDFGPTLFAEKLEEKHAIKVNHETVRRLLIKNNLYDPRQKKAVQRTWREPKHHKGEMVQLDGSYHIWFGDSYSTLILFIDDATKEVFARFQPESTQGVTETYELFLKKYGRPRKIYCDRGKVFKVNNNKQGESYTQFRRMNNELDVEMIYARSPQAKGRVERVFRTLQDRLEKELRLLNIITLDQANQMLDAFLEKFNKKFSISPRNSEELYRSVEGYDLNSILCYKYQRKLNNDYTISYKNRLIQIVKGKQPIMLYPRDVIEIYESFDGTISLWKKGLKLNCKEIEKRTKITSSKPSIDDDKVDKRYGKKVKKGHPWRQNSYEIEKVIKPDISNESKPGHF